MKASVLAIVIEPDSSLSETARVISMALELSLQREATGRFEEYPAYMGMKAGVEYALLGCPDPEHDIRDNPTNQYCLQVSPMQQSISVPDPEPIVAALRSAGLRVS